MKRMTLAGLLLAVGVTGVLVYTGLTRDRDYRQLITDGNRALAGDRTFVAIEAFSGAIALKSDSMLAYLKRGQTYRRRGEFAAALRDLRRATELDPAATRPLEELGDVNYILEQYATADQRYEAYLRLDDDTPRVLYKLALTRYWNGSPAAAVTLLERAVSIDDRFADAYYLLGLSRQAQGQLDVAVTVLQQAVRLAPGAIEAREVLADVYGSLDRVQDQIDQLEALAALDPERPDRQVALGLAYAGADRTDLAVLTLGLAAERNPEQSQIYVALGRIWLDVAERLDDRVALGKALEALDAPPLATDGSSEASVLRGRALLFSGQVDEAERAFLEATQSFPVTPEAYRYLGDLAERREDLAGALDALISYEALAATRQSPRRGAAAAVRIGALAVRLDDPGMAATWFQRAVDLAPPDPALLRRLADAHWRAGNRVAAREAVARGLERAPDDRALLALRQRFQ